MEATRSRRSTGYVLLFGLRGWAIHAGHNHSRKIGVPFQQTSDTLQIKGDLTAILTNVREKQVLFIDGFIDCSGSGGNLVLRAEDYKLDIIIGRGPAARTHHGREAVHLHRRDHTCRVAFIAPALRFDVLRWSLVARSCELWSGRQTF
jgi:Holliday junction resolvasome RuvABC ATP-dependent DNA helicase subunit